jgi:hypothetical protein
MYYRKHYRMFNLELWFGNNNATLIELAGESSPHPNCFGLSLTSEETSHSSGRSVFHNRKHHAYKLIVRILKVSYAVILRVK